MTVWRRLHEDGDGWMSSICQNDVDVIVHMTSRPREAITLYCFVDFGAWTSLSATRIAGMNAEGYSEIFYDDVVSAACGDADSIVVNDQRFLVPNHLQAKMVAALDAVVAAVQAPQSKT
jgi:hypothetical protein